MNLDDEDIERIAQRVAELLRPHIAELASTTPPKAGETEVAPAVDDADVDALRDWVNTHCPTWRQAINGDFDDWCAAIADAAGQTDPVAALQWALDPDCPTSFWRDTYSERPIPAPSTTTRGKRRYGPLTQLLAEYRISLNEPERSLGDVDVLVEACNARVRELGVHPEKSCAPRARKNALEVLAEAHGDPEYVLAIISWCTTRRSHWRANLQGAPTVKTFRSMRSDWRMDGQEFDLAALDTEVAEVVSAIANGWAYFLATAIGAAEKPQLSPQSMQRIHAALTGTDGGMPVAEDDLKQAIKWICAANEGRTRFYADGVEFPRPDRLRKALVDMRTSASGRATVSDTNYAAGDGGTDSADDDLKGAL